jgi:Fe-S cluster assembly protein SufB
MPTDDMLLKEYSEREYRHGFVTEIESDSIEPGLSEGVVRLISEKKGEPD